MNINFNKAINSTNQVAAVTSTILPPPPPYYEQLPTLHQPPVMHQSAYYITPMSISVGSSPNRLRCPNCHADVVSQITHKSGCMTWTLCGSICALGFKFKYIIFILIILF